MTKYRISVSFDEKNYFWIVVDNGIFIRSPTKEDLAGTKIKSYNKTNICPRCREDKERYGNELMDKSILYPKNARQFDIKDENVWICERHSGRQRNNHNSINKSVQKHTYERLNIVSAEEIKNRTRSLEERFWEKVWIREDKE